MIYEEEVDGKIKYVVSLETQVLIFWKKTYEFICDTEDDVKKLLIPHDKTYINDAISIKIHPSLSDDVNDTYLKCIVKNKKIHKGHIRVV